MSDIVATMKVKPWGEGQGDYVEINAADFDPKIHTEHADDLDDADTDGNGHLTKAEICADLEALKVEFDPRAKRADLFALRNVARAKRDAGE